MFVGKEGTVNCNFVTVKTAETDRSVLQAVAIPYFSLSETH